MKSIMKIIALLLCLFSAALYCTLSNAGDICQNQAMDEHDGCAVYVVTD